MQNACPADHGSVGRVDDADDRLEGLGVDVDLEELERGAPRCMQKAYVVMVAAVGFLLPVVGEEGSCPADRGWRTQTSFWADPGRAVFVTLPEVGTSPGRASERTRAARWSRCR